MTSFTREAVEQLSLANDEPEWMLDFRLGALRSFEATHMPTTNDEPWRRTDLRRFKLNQIGPSLNGSGAGADVPAYLGEQLTEDKTGGILVQVDGAT